MKEREEQQRGRREKKIGGSTVVGDDKAGQTKNPTARIQGVPRSLAFGRRQ